MTREFNKIIKSHDAVPLNPKQMQAIYEKSQGLWKLFYESSAKDLAFYAPDQRIPLIRRIYRRFKSLF